MLLFFSIATRFCYSLEKQQKKIKASLCAYIKEHKIQDNNTALTQEVMIIITVIKSRADAPNTQRRNGNIHRGATPQERPGNAKLPASCKI